MATLFFVELRTTQWQKLAAWYREVVGLRGLLRVNDDQFALLGDEVGRLAIVGVDAASPAADRWSLAFEVDDLGEVGARLAAAGSQVEGPKSSPEGYDELLTADPDGNRVRLVAWRE